MIISNKPVQFLLLALLALTPTLNFAASNDSIADKTEVVEPVSEGHEAVSSHAAEKEFSPTDLINSHIGDSHEFHIADWGEHPISFYLPVTLWTNSGLEVFSSEHDERISMVKLTESGKQLVEQINTISIVTLTGILNAFDEDELNNLNKQLKKIFDLMPSN